MAFKKKIIIAALTSCCIIFHIQSTVPPRLLIKIPTRSRCAQFFKVIDSYYENLSGEIPVTFVISCDADDTSMNNFETQKKLESYPNLIVRFGKNRSKVEAYNNDMESCQDFDILLVSSDDTQPTKDFDKKIVNLMLQHFPDFDGVINFNDGYVGPSLNTLPVIGRKFYNRLGCIYHPSYKSLCCDNELTLISKILCREVYCNEVIIKHEHPSNNNKIKYDSLYRQNDAFFTQDQENFKERQKRFFDLDISKINYPFKLSILMANSDSQNFTQMYAELKNQIRSLQLSNDIEILFPNTFFESSNGRLKNDLLNRSLGEYVCFIDDNINILPNYIETIFENLRTKPDCLTIAGITKKRDRNGGGEFFLQSSKYDNSLIHHNTLCKPLNHLNPTKRAIAIQFHFLENQKADKNYRENELRKSGLLKKETVITIPYICIRT